MPHQSIREACPFHASTGAHFYDNIQFSVRPNGILIGNQPDRIGIVRHSGLASKAPVRSSSNNEDGDLIVLNLSSGGEYERRGDGQPIRRSLRRGDVSFIPCGMQTELIYPGSNSALLAFFPKGALQRTAPSLGREAFRPRYSERNRRLTQLVMLAELELRAPGFAGDLVIDGLIQAVAALLSRQSDTMSLSEVDRIYLSPARLARVIDYIDGNLQSEIALKDLAEVAQFSPFHFSRVFKRATGESPYQFVSSRRLERAMRLLEEGELPLAQLALCCGFSSQAHFTSAFSKAIGISPGRYRRNIGLAKD